MTKYFLSEEWVTEGSYKVDFYKEVMVDQTRTTPANGSVSGKDNRTIAVRLWVPRSKRTYPLLIYSHGFVSTWRGGAYLAEHLATRGYIVAVPNFPLTNAYTSGGPNITDIVNQPGDVSFIIDTLLDKNSSRQHYLSGRINEKKIGVMGLSLGGLTSTLLGFHPKWRDNRIGAVVSIAGPTAMLGEDFFSGNDLPFLMLAGDIDLIVPYESNAIPVPKRVPRGELVTLHSASHTGFSGNATLLGFLDNPDRVGCFFVNRNLLDDDENQLRSLFSSSGTPISEEFESEICVNDKFPKSMNLELQRTISIAVITSFFEREFSEDHVRRANAEIFLQTGLAKNFESVTVVSK